MLVFFLNVQNKPNGVIFYIILIDLTLYAQV